MASCIHITYCCHRNKSLKRRNHQLSTNCPFAMMTSNLNKKLVVVVFGNVYKALFQSEQVVVKTCEHIEDRNRFLHEAIILEQYEHPNIVQLKGVVTEQFPKFPLYIIMEIPSAMSLYDFLRKQATSYEKEQLRKMCTHVCVAMKYLEENGHVHCNLMAQNCSKLLEL